MSESLQPYCPNQEMIAGIYHQLVKAGVHPQDIPQDWLVSISAATRRWINTTQEGAKEATSLLGLEIFQGEANKNYTLRGVYRDGDKVLKSEDVQLIRGVTVSGRPIPFSQLKISEKVGLLCDSCGIMSHCAQTVRHPTTDRIETLCNHCVTNHESFYVKDKGGENICRRCTVTACSHHPHRLVVVNG